VSGLCAIADISAQLIGCDPNVLALADVMQAVLENTVGWVSVELGKAPCTELEFIAS
jgi:hypothetical protein